MKKLNYFLIAITILIISCSSTKTGNDQLKKNTNLINLEIVGLLEADSKENFEISECIVNSAMILGVESYTDSEQNSRDSSFVNGNYAYSYFVDDYSSEAGEVKFKFSYQIKNGIINYKFYDFEHNGRNTKFKSIGILSKNWNENIGSTFTENQYSEIMTDIKLNVANSIRMISKYCLK